jgi:hypothetical protein
MSHQNERQNHNIKTTNKSLTVVAKFKHVETTITNQTYIQEEIKNRLNLVMLATIQLRVFCLSSPL